MEHATHSAHHLALILSNILLFFGIAGIAVPLLQRLRMSPVLLEGRRLSNRPIGILCFSILLMPQVGTEDGTIEKIIKKLRDQNALTNA